MYFFYESILIYLLFNFVTTIFGFIILSFLIKDRSYQKYSFAKQYLLSHTNGIFCNIGLVYVFITIWEFNSFTGFYFFLVFDLIGAIYLINRSKNGEKFVNKIIMSMKKQWITIKLNRKIIMFFVILVIYILTFYTYKYWEDFSNITSHYNYDPYTWQGQVYHLITENSLNYNYFFNVNDYVINTYPAGLFLYFAGMMSSITNLGLVQIHFIIKVIPSIILIENILHFALIAYELFPKKRIFIFFASSSILFYDYFIYRSLLVRPNILIT